MFRSSLLCYTGDECCSGGRKSITRGSREPAAPILHPTLVKAIASLTRFIPRLKQPPASPKATRRVPPCPPSTGAPPAGARKLF